MKRMQGIALAVLAATLMLVPQVSAQAPGPGWKLIGVHLPTNVAPGEEGELFLIAVNIGGGPATGPITLTDSLPAGVKVLKPLPPPRDNDPASPPPSCEVLPDEQTVTCTSAGPISSSRQLEMRIPFEVKPSTPEGELADEATISGGGANTVSTETTLTVSEEPAPFGFLPPNEGGPDAPLTEADGSPATQAGSHPYQLTASLGFPTKSPGGFLIGSETAKEVIVDLPRGMIVDPTATPVLCTEAQLVSAEGCPPASQVGQISAITVEVIPKAATSPLFNMVPAPGEAASLGFNALGIGVFVHLSGEVRSDGDFGLSGVTEDILALPFHPIFGARAELWGDPSSPLHDHVRGNCSFSEAACSEPVDQQKTALITLPGECTGEPSETVFWANTWQLPDLYEEGVYESASLDGAPTEVGGCEALEFEPSIEAQPTTDQVDSPSGFDFNLHQPQDSELEEEGGGPSLSTAVLKDALVTLPEGLVVNPAAGQSQQACSPTQIGLESGVGNAPVRFNKVPDSCPDAAKIGQIEVRTPLLAERDASETEFERDEEGNPIPRPLIGDVFLAEPFQNPFGTLLAIYFSVEDPKSGTVAKFATKVEADPVTGRLTNTLTESPQLPLEDVSLQIFGGDRGALRTPAACATYETTTELVPWSEGPEADPSDSFALSGSPRGACPSSAESAPNTPGFVAGTVTPRAGTFSPFVLRVSREDATQPIGGFEATLPPGLSAKLAGVPVCSDADLARAIARANPNEGKAEQANPSCPAASEVGTVEVAAGAGPTPLNVTGRVYLTGPYKGAPLSVAIITPAVAGPFDLGTVVVRTALYVDGKTAQVRAVSDPLPTILEGIPLDVRSAVVRMGRPQFTLNPTNCEPQAVKALATSVFGQGAALTSPFQVGGCAELPFKPKLALRLFGGTKRGGHPRLQGTLTMKPGEANIAATSVALPRSEFLDQSHIRTVCTRVQFAAEQCPKGAIYGHAKAITPLLDEVLEGPIYLRSSDNELPDAVGVLRGPASRPIQIEVSARIDSFKRGIRANFEAVPDAPVSKVVVTMQGGAKGLLINSRNLCKTKKALRSATVRMVGQNGKTHNSRPVLRNSCRKGGGKGKGKRRARHGRR